MEIINCVMRQVTDQVDIHLICVNTYIYSIKGARHQHAERSKHRILPPHLFIIISWQCGVAAVCDARLRTL